MGEGVLLSLPTESIAVRVIVASLAAVWLVRLVLRSGLRAPGVRAATALVPAAALIAVVAIFWGSLRLPGLMRTVEAIDALPVPVRDGYLHFAPIAAPLLMAAWAAIVLGRVAVRVLRAVRLRRIARTALRSRPAPAWLDILVADLARRMGLAAPPVALTADCVGGAIVVGIRRPIVVIDERLCRDLDDAELEGVLAHELAHVKRRDNLVAAAVGAVRDSSFFVPGGHWATRHLHTERELAADQVAIRVTRRPGALASGLLKVIGGLGDLATGPTPGECAALAPRGTLVARVERLVDERPAPGPLRRGTETVVLLTTLALAVGAAVAVPAMIAGDAGQRDAMAVVWSAPPEPVAEPEREVEPRAFQVYRRSSLGVQQPHAGPAPRIDDDITDVRRSTLLACGTQDAPCPHREAPPPSLGLQPRPSVEVDDDLLLQWRATPVMSSGDGLSLYWLRKVE